MAKDCWFFPLIEKGFPRINSCILVHGYSSCDLGLVTAAIVYGIAALFMVQVHAKLK
jgi:hypothetical protein